MNETLCDICDYEKNDFIVYLKYTNQLSYDRIIEKLVRYNKIQDLFLEMRDTKMVWKTIFSSRKTLQITESLRSYDIPDYWIWSDCYKVRLV